MINTIIRITPRTMAPPLRAFRYAAMPPPLRFAADAAIILLLLLIDITLLRQR